MWIHTHTTHTHIQSLILWFINTNFYFWPIYLQNFQYCSSVLFCFGSVLQFQTWLNPTILFPLKYNLYMFNLFKDHSKTLIYSSSLPPSFPPSLPHSFPSLSLSSSFPPNLATSLPPFFSPSLSFDIDPLCCSHLSVLFNFLYLYKTIFLHNLINSEIFCEVSLTLDNSLLHKTPV